MKQFLKKLVILIILLVTISTNIGITLNISYAAEEGENSESSSALSSEEEEQLEDESTLGLVLDTIAGAFTGGFKLIIFGVVKALKVVIGGLAGGTNDISQIIFTDAVDNTDESNPVNIGAQIFSVDFFNLSSGSGTMNTIRKSIAGWYFSIRNIASAILLLILLYIGIRIATSTIALEEAKYKTMFRDWVISLILLFVMHYIIIFTIEINKVLVSTIYKAGGSQNATVFSAYIDKIASSIFDIRFSVGWGALIIYLVMIGVTLLYVFEYIKRMITVGFLIVIAPLVTVTYAADKMGDTKSQALNTWLKEFVYNVLIQPFHCIIYLVFVSSSIKLLADKPSMASAILSVSMIFFMFKAEDIVKTIFSFNSQSMARAAGSMAVLTTGFSLMKQGMSKDKNKKSPKPDKIPEMNDPGSSNIPSERNKEGKTEDTGNKGKKETEGTKNNGQNNSNDATGTVNTSTESPEKINDSSKDKGTDENTNNQNSSDGGDNDNSEENPPKPKRKVKDRAKKMLTNFGTWYGKKATSVATRVILAGIGAAAGYEGAMAGYRAGEAVNEFVKNKHNKSGVKKAVKNNESKYASAYDKYKSQSGLNDEQIKRKTQNYLNGNYDVEKMSDEEYEYFTYAQQMQKTYSAVGEEDIEEKMMDTLDMIRDGEIPRYEARNNNEKVQGGRKFNNSLNNGEPANQNNGNPINPNNVNPANQNNGNPINPNNVNPANQNDVDSANPNNVNPENQNNGDPANPNNVNPENQNNSDPINPNNVNPANQNDGDPANPNNVNPEN